MYKYNNIRSKTWQTGKKLRALPPKTRLGNLLLEAIALDNKF
jgi:hypothetical protein